MTQQEHLESEAEFYAEIENDIKKLDEALKLDPQNADTYSHLGDANRALDDLHTAIDDYTKAIEINPNFAKAHYERRGLVARTYPEFLGHLEGGEKSSRQGVVALVMVNLFAQNRADVKGDLPMVEMLKIFKPDAKDSTNSKTHD